MSDLSKILLAACIFLTLWDRIYFFMFAWDMPPAPKLRCMAVWSTGCCAILAGAMVLGNEFSGRRFLGLNGETTHAERLNVQRLPSIVESRPRMVDDASSRLKDEASSLQLAATKLVFKASSIGDTVHLPSCRYVGQMEHAVEYESLAAARADGKRLCSICLERHMALWGRQE